jgi:hypothetical protein
LWEWDLDDADTENILRKLDNPELAMESSGVRKAAPSFNPYDNGRGTKRR